NVEWCRQLGDQKGPGIEPIKDPAPNRIGQREEHAIENILIGVWEYLDHCCVLRHAQNLSTVLLIVKRRVDDRAKAFRVARQRRLDPARTPRSRRRSDTVRLQTHFHHGRVAAVARALDPQEKSNSAAFIGLRSVEMLLEKLQHP